MNSLMASFAAGFFSSTTCSMQFPIPRRSIRNPLCIQPPPRFRPPPKFVCMAEPHLIAKLESAEKTWKELSVKLADPDVVSNPSEYQKLAQSMAELDEVVLTYRRFKDCEKQLEETKALAKEVGNDEDMAEMIAFEVETLSSQIKELEERLKVLLIPTDPLNERNIMLEVRAGTGGDEAGLWAGDLVVTWPSSIVFCRRIQFSRVLTMAEHTSETSLSKTYKHTNHLEAEHSPYLLQHAHNPVDWYPWGEEAFAEARRRDVPIFLSIEYSTCHWCRVMEVESFENEEVAKLLNDWFVSIKVDREERPDVDKVYMTYVQALYGGGGWPLSVFLSPDLKPLMGGTYFPPEDKYGMPGFKTILRKVKEAWDRKRDVLVQSGSFAIEQLSEALSTAATLDKLPDGVPQKAMKLCAEKLADSFDSKYVGFGSAPKFPGPVEVQLMLYHLKKLKETEKLNGAKEDLSM